MFFYHCAEIIVLKNRSKTIHCTNCLIHQINTLTAILMNFDLRCIKQTKNNVIDRQIPFK